MTFSVFSCRTLEFSDDKGIVLQSNLSGDSLLFDTVFTEVTSYTKEFRLYNNTDENVIVDRVWLKNGAASFFRINVDGFPGNEVRGVELLANDSMWVFVDVNIDPNNETNPFVIVEELMIDVNGTEQSITLEAWGQNAYYYRPTTFIQDFPPYSTVEEYSDYFPVGPQTTLPNDKPHIIYNYLAVDAGMTLTIQPGTEIHFYKNGSLWASPTSNIIAEGTMSNPIEFKGFRTDSVYGELPGQWDRIWINESSNNSSFNYCNFTGAFIGIQPQVIQSLNVAPNSVDIKNCYFFNSQLTHVWAENMNTTIENTIFADAGSHCIIGAGGGELNVLHSTIGNYYGEGSAIRSESSVYILNYIAIPYDDDSTTYVEYNKEVTFSNSIVYGTWKEEISLNVRTGGTLAVAFNNCVLRTELDPTSPIFNSCVFNPTSTDFNYPDPVFTDPYQQDFNLYPASAAVNIGDPNLTGTLTTDYAGNMRDSEPDAGALELVQ